MTDVCFNANNLSIILKDIVSVENNVRANVDNVNNIIGNLKNEISAFGAYGKNAIGIIQAQTAEIKSMIGAIDRKIASAESQRQSEIAMPSRPYISPDTPPYVQDSMMAQYHRDVKQVEVQNAKIRDKNRRINEYITRCNQAKTQINLLIGRMLNVETSAKKEVSSTEHTVNDLWIRANDAAQKGPAINSKMNDFYCAFNNVCEAAMKIEANRPTSVKNIFLSKEFKIKNTHTHFAASGGFGHNDQEYNRFSDKRAMGNNSSTDIFDSSEEILIKAKDKASFFESLGNAKKIKMSNLSLHKFGGKAFVSEMNELGYIAIVQENGTILDMEGKIHWEKKY